MLAPEERLRLGKQNGAPDRKMSVREARMPLQEERWPSGKKDEGSGRQRNGHPRKTGAREAKKPAGKAKRPSGLQKNGRDEKKRLRGTGETDFCASPGCGMAGGGEELIGTWHPAPAALRGVGEDELIRARLGHPFSVSRALRCYTPASDHLLASSRIAGSWLGQSCRTAGSKSAPLGQTSV